MVPENRTLLTRQLLFRRQLRPLEMKGATRERFIPENPQLASFPGECAVGASAFVRVRRGRGFAFL